MVLEWNSRFVHKMSPMTHHNYLQQNHCVLFVCRLRIYYYHYAVACTDSLINLLGKHVLI